MGYEYITKYDSPNFGYPRGKRGQNKIEKIVIHHWGADGAAFYGVVNWLCRKSGNSSAHFVVEAGKVACLVNHKDAAWHAGGKSINTHSIGIECRPEMSDSDLETVCELVANLYKTYGVLPIIGHRDVASTECPGRYYSKLGYIKQRAIELMNGGKSAPNVSQKLSVDEVAKLVIEGKYGNNPERSERLEAEGYDSKVIQNRVNELLGNSTPQKITISVGSSVRVRKNANTYNGQSLADFVYKTTYKVIEVKGDRAVIGLRGIVVAAVRTKDLIIV